LAWNFLREKKQTNGHLFGMTNPRFTRTQNGALS
jgi:hypothetical protein